MPLKEVLDDIDRWQAAGETAAMARVVDVVGSSPREPGAAMAVSEAGEVAGSVSGGCVEGAVVEAALEILGGEREPGVISFGYSDEDAFAVGLTCGGTIRLFVEPVDVPIQTDDLYVALQQAIDAAGAGRAGDRGRRRRASAPRCWCGRSGRPARHARRRRPRPGRRA